MSTPGGTVPIECLEPGDLVWSIDESTGDVKAKPVVQLIRTSPSILVVMEYTVDGEVNYTITGTLSHPFYDVGQERFVAMGELEPGALLCLSDGSTASVLSIEFVTEPGSRETLRAGWDGRAFSTYNIEVKDFQTYFAGEAPVWVHNSGDLCKKLALAFTATRRHLRRQHPDGKTCPVEAFVMLRRNIIDLSGDESRRLVNFVIDEIERDWRNGILEPRWIQYLERGRGREFHFDEERKRSERVKVIKEYFAAKRFEMETGVQVVRPPLGPGSNGQRPDWVVPGMDGTWDVKGPLEKGDIHSFVDSLVGHMGKHPQGDEILVIDLAGMPNAERSRVFQVMGASQYPYYRYLGLEE